MNQRAINSAEEFKKLEQAMSAQKGAQPFVWENEAIKELLSEDEVITYIEDVFKVRVDESFTNLGLEKQKAVTAGIKNTLDRFGEGLFHAIGSFTSKAIDGRYNPQSGYISISTTAKDPYIVGVHEMVHAIDAEKSQLYARFAQLDDELRYNIHSDYVLRGARRELSLRANSIRYIDMIFEIAGYNSRTYEIMLAEPSELVAYALEREMTSQSSTLGQVIARRF